MSNQDKAALAQQAVPPPAVSNPHRGGTSAYLAAEYWNEGWNACREAMLAAAPAAHQAIQCAAVGGDDVDALLISWANQVGVKWIDSLSGDSLTKEPVLAKHLRLLVCAAKEVKPPVQPNGEPKAAPQAEQQAALPRLPESVRLFHSELTNQSYYGYTAEQMRDYARAALAAQQAEREPIDMVLHCPKCGMQHIDASEPPLEFEPGAAQWNNPPHRSHLCHGCSHIWRPADVPTNGVQAVKTKGKADSPVMQQAEREPLTDEQRELIASRASDKCTDRMSVALYAIAETERAHGIGHHVPGHGSQP